MVHLQSLLSASLGHERVQCQGASGVSCILAWGVIQVCMVHLQSLLSASLGHERVQRQGASGISYTSALYQKQLESEASGETLK